MTSKKTVEEKKEEKKFQFFIWNAKIHNRFLSVLIVCVIMLFGAMILQSLYIQKLEYKIEHVPTSEAFDYDYKVMMIEDYLNKTGLEVANVADMLVYYKLHNYTKIYYDVGYIEATMAQCMENGCFDVTYRFNQNRGMYIDVLLRTKKK